MNSWRIALVLFAACAPYQSGGVFQTANGSRSFECLDLNAAPTLDHGRSWIVIRYTFGNPCRYAAPIDLSAIRVRATHGDSGARLPAFDPRDELRPASLDGRRQAEELIAYEIPPNLVGRTLNVCVTLSDVAQSEELIEDYCFNWEAD